MIVTSALVLATTALGVAGAACPVDDPTTSSSVVAASVGDATTNTVDLSRLADWQTVEITDVDGETFTLADFVGTPVFVETFATWCSNCRKQLTTTNEAAGKVCDDAVVIALSVETELSGDDVARYAADNEFANVRFAVMTPELLAMLAGEFGNSVLNPPSTPHFIIDADGVPGELATGFESVEDITANLQEAAAS